MQTHLEGGQGRGEASIAANIFLRFSVFLVTLACVWPTPDRAKGGPDPMDRRRGWKRRLVRTSYAWLSTNSYTWTQARAAADSMTWDGLHGYLATVTSAPESVILQDNFSSQLLSTFMD